MFAIATFKVRSCENTFRNWKSSVMQDTIDQNERKILCCTNDNQSWKCYMLWSMGKGSEEIGFKIIEYELVAAHDLRVFTDWSDVTGGCEQVSCHLTILSAVPTSKGTTCVDWNLNGPFSNEEIHNTWNICCPWGIGCNLVDSGATERLSAGPSMGPSLDCWVRSVNEDVWENSRL